MRTIRLLTLVATFFVSGGTSIYLATEPAQAQQVPTLVDSLYPADIVDPEATVNGCGSQGDDGIDVPDSFLGIVSFTPACDWHDQCYGTKGLSQGYCDRGMLAKSLTACGPLGGCSTMAVAYYAGVSVFGGQPYREGQQDACEREERRRGRGHGDPHINTFDGETVSFQAAGVFRTVLQGGDTLVQTRTYPVSDHFSVFTGVGIRLDTQIVTIEINPTLKTTAVFVDGMAVTDTHFEVGDGVVSIEALAGTTGSISVWRRGGFQVDVVTYGTSLDVSVHVPESMWGTVSGLFGNADGNPDNDVLDLNGEPFPLVEILGSDFFARFTDRAFNDSLRVEPTNSWFVDSHDYDYHAPDITKYPLPLPPALAEQYAAALATCREAGVPETELSGCVFDVVFGGDPAWANRNVISATRSDEIAHPHQHGQNIINRPSTPAGPITDNSALIFAIADQDLNAVRDLIAAGYDVNAESGGAFPLLMAVASGNVDIATLLIRNGARIDSDFDGIYTPLAFAAGSGSVEMVRLLLNEGADPNGQVSSGDFTSTTPLDAAAINNAIDVMRILLAAGAATDRGTFGDPLDQITVLLLTPEAKELLGR
jgi:hypothetical protein